MPVSASPANGFFAKHGTQDHRCLPCSLVRCHIQRQTQNLAIVDALKKTRGLGAEYVIKAIRAWC